MNQRTQGAIASWNAEVEAEMVKLIEAGTPPYDAARRAREIVSNRRRDRARRPSSERGGE